MELIGKKTLDIFLIKSSMQNIFKSMPLDNIKNIGTCCDGKEL